MQTVALQLPEGLQLFACTLADIIGAYAGVEVLPPRRKFPMQSWPNYPMPLSAAGARRGLPPWVCVGGARDPRAHDGRAGADARTQVVIMGDVTYGACCVDSAFSICAASWSTECRWAPSS